MEDPAEAAEAAEETVQPNMDSFGSIFFDVYIYIYIFIYKCSIILIHIYIYISIYVTFPAPIMNKFEKMTGLKLFI